MGRYLHSMYQYIAKLKEVFLPVIRFFGWHSGGVSRQNLLSLHSDASQG